MTFNYVQPTEEQIKEMQKFREEFTKLYDQIKLLPDSRGKSICLTKLEEANMWLNKAITNNSNV
jgi:hypothetical protein